MQVILGLILGAIIMFLGIDKFDLEVGNSGSKKLYADIAMRLNELEDKQKECCDSWVIPEEGNR